MDSKSNHFNSEDERKEINTKLKAPIDNKICNSPSRYSGTGYGLRVMLYSHDTLGLGHIQRCLKISRWLRSRYPDLSILLITGSSQLHRFQIPGAIDYIKLPAVRKIARERYESRFPGASFERILKLRTNLILETVKAYHPHLLLVDHSPHGMKGEIMPSLEWLRKNNNACMIALGMRDILDDPQTVIDIWSRQGTYDVLRYFYDRIFIYGSPLIFDPISSYEFPSDIKSKTQFCGYITDYDASDDSSGLHSRRTGGGKKFVVLTVGGGDGWGEDLIADFLEILQERRSNIPFRSLILTGPFLEEEHWNRFKHTAGDLPVNILKFVRQTGPFIAQSDLVISTGGYNTVTDILCHARKALVIPRIKYRKEQFLRARRMSELGLITFMHPEEVSSERLYDCVSDLLAGDGDPLDDARAQKLIPLDGGRRLAERLGDIFVEIESLRESKPWPKIQRT